MSVREYIGARYIPLFSDPIEWDSTLSYEPLTVVKHQGGSYVSRQFVPEGVDISNTQFWILWADFNAQLEQYRQEVRQFDGRITANADAIATETSAREAADSAMSGLITTNANAISAETSAREAADSAMSGRIVSLENAPKILYSADSPNVIYLSTNGSSQGTGEQADPLRSMSDGIAYCEKNGIGNISMVMLDSGSYPLAGIRFISNLSIHVYKATADIDCTIDISGADDFCWYNSHININGANSQHPIAINVAGVSRNYIWFDNCLTTFSYVKLNYPIIFYGGAFNCETFIDVQTLDFEYCNALITGNMIIHGSDNMNWGIRARACTVYISANITTDINITADKQGNNGFITLSGALLMFRTMVNTTVPAYKYAFGITATGSTIHLAVVEYNNLAKLAAAPAQLWRNTVLAQGNVTVLPGSDTVPTV